MQLDDVRDIVLEENTLKTVFLLRTEVEVATKLEKEFVLENFEVIQTKLQLGQEKNVSEGFGDIRVCTNNISS